MIGVLALIILGPERLPKVARTAGHWMGKARSMIRDVKADLKSEMNEAELGELKSIGEELRAAGNTFKSQVESTSQAAQEKASAMDSAINDALNKPMSTAKKSDAVAPAKHKTAKKKASRNKAGQKKTSRNLSPENAAKKPARKKKVTKKKTSQLKKTT